MLVYFALGNAKVPNANGFASQWNIGFSNSNFRKSTTLVNFGHEEKVTFRTQYKKAYVMLGTLLVL